MRIVVNALSVFSGGGLTSMTNLLPALVRVDGENEYVVIVSAKQAAVVSQIPKNVGVHSVRFNPKNVLVRLLYEQLVLPFVLRRLGARWLYSVGSLTTLLAPCKVLLLIENANPYSVLDVAWNRKDRLRNWALRTLGNLSARKADVVRFLSENSRDIISGMIKLPPSKTIVIPHGLAAQTGESRTADEGMHLPDRFILTVSNLGPHKNIHTLVDAFEKLVKVNHYPGSLVIVGAQHYPEYFESLKSRIKGTQLGSKVIFLGWVDPESLPTLYRKAEVFVFPSAEETFGMPVVEAMGYGVPVVVPSPGARFFIPYEEICRTGAEYFDAFDSSSLCEHIWRVLSDEQRRQHIVMAGKERAQHYRWDDVASGLVSVFRRVNSR